MKISNRSMGRIFRQLRIISKHSGIEAITGSKLPEWVISKER